jgi:rRNA-processing protein FCF1
MTTAAKPPKEPLKIILDSNALFVPLQFKIDIMEELKTLLNMRFELALLSPVLEELRKLEEEGSPKTRRDASYALKLAEKLKVIDVTETFASPDDAIVKVADKLGYLVFTNDRVLRKRLRDINVPVIYVRQKSRLEIDGRL